jgi:hypothetical protein
MVPEFHEQRLTLTEMEHNFREFIGGPELIDIDETMRLMLADYFYGDFIEPSPGHTVHREHDRALVFPFGKLPTMNPQELTAAIDTLGEVFWTLTDTIMNRMLRVSANYEHRPNECFYKFYPMSKELVVYTPVMEGILYPPTLHKLDARAVMVVCADTLPSYMKTVLNSVLSPL